MYMPTGIVIPVDVDEPIFRKEVHALADYQEVVGGFIQVVELDNPRTSLYMDEEGKLKRLPVNRRASLLMWVHRPIFHGADFVCGPALLIGPSDDDGNDTDVPTELDDLLFDTLSYKMEVQMEGSEGNWNSRAARYPTWDAAYLHAVILIQQWASVNGVRVVPA